MIAIFRDSTGQEWQIDVEGCLLLIRTWAQAKARADALKVRPAPDDMVEAFFDNRSFLSSREASFTEAMGTLTGLLESNAAGAVRFLASRLDATPGFDEQYRNRMDSVTRRNMRTIHGRVNWGQRNAERARFVRDLSAVVFMACIPLAGLSEGVVLGAHVGGSVFQGIATYQDTDSAIAGVVAAKFAFLSTMFTLPGSASRTATAVFTLHNIGTSSLRSSLVTMISPGNDASQFTETVRTQAVSELGSELANQALGDFLGKIAMATIPAVIEADRSRTAVEVHRPQSIVSDSADTSLLDLRNTPLALRREFERYQRERRRREQMRRRREQVSLDSDLWRLLNGLERRPTESETYVRSSLLRPT